MNIQKADILSAAKSGIISQTQADQLLQFLEKETANRSQFNLGYVIYYIGGALILFAVAWFIIRRWGSLEGLEISLAATASMLTFLVSGNWLATKRQQDFPASFLLTAGICLSAMIYYGIQRHFGWIYGSYAHPDTWFWLQNSMFVSSCVVFLIAGWFFYYQQFALIGLPLALSLALIGLELGGLWFPGYDYRINPHTLFELFFGVLILFCSYLIDVKTKNFNVVWGYVVGCAWTSYHLISFLSGQETTAFIYLLANLFLIFVGLFLRRIIFGFTGSIGLLVYTHHIVFETFHDTLSSLGLLVGAGIVFLWLGFLFQKYQTKIYAFFDDKMPDSSKSYRPAFKELNLKNFVL